MHFSSSKALHTQLRNIGMAAWWAMGAYCRIAGIDMHVLTAGPAFAARPAQAVMQRRKSVGLTHCISFVASGPSEMVDLQFCFR